MTTLCVSSAVLTDGEKLIVDNNTVMHNKRLSFMCEIDDSDNDGLIRIGHGKTDYASSYLELTKDTLIVYQHYVDTAVVISKEHGLKLSGSVTVTVDVDYGYATVRLMTPSGNVKLSDVSWYGRNGDVYAECEGLTVKNAKLNWYCPDYEKPIYIFGDSYLNALSPERWPYYLHRDGFDSCFMTGYPGMGSARGAIDLELALERGTPKYAVWLLGMNNEDKGCVNAEWLSAVEKLLAACDEKNITPILSTIPSVPARDNSFKNKWVRESGRRYIDMERAVGADKSVEWCSGMLAADQVHPAALGAEALYMQIVAELPELRVH